MDRVNPSAGRRVRTPMRERESRFAEPTAVRRGFARQNRWVCGLLQRYVLDQAAQCGASVRANTGAPPWPLVSASPGNGMRFNSRFYS